jgi:hypothetical protein
VEPARLSLEGSIGWFFGQGDDAISRFAERDFVTLSLKTCFQSPLQPSLVPAARGNRVHLSAIRSDDTL